MSENPIAQEVKRLFMTLQIETCIVCGEPTHYKINDETTKSLYRIEGIGQVCIDCHKILKKKSK